MLVWSNSGNWLKRKCAHKLFTALTRLIFRLSIYNVVTLKFRSRSPKSNHFFPPSWWCICVSLVKFQPLVKEIHVHVVCTQTFYCINKADFLSIYNVVNKMIKIRSVSPKSNHFIPPSWWCICASLVKFHPLDKEIVITKTCLYNFDPLKPYFYIVKLRFKGVYIIFLIFAQKHRLWYSLEMPCLGSSNTYPQSMFRAEIWKISEFFIWKFSISRGKFSYTTE